MKDIFNTVTKVKEPTYGHILERSLETHQKDYDFSLMDAKLKLKFDILKTALSWSIDLLAKKLSQNL